MKTYRERLADAQLRLRLASAGAVLIEGPKWCGKSTTALQLAGSVLEMQNPATRANNQLLAKTDASLLLTGAVPRLIDEWQLAPTLWDAVRYEVDRRGEVGQFILTGSAVPADRSEVAHSGAGRFSRLLMHPMTLVESGESNGSVSLSGLFSGAPLPQVENPLGLRDLARTICRGGWPQAVVNLQGDAALRVARDYVDLVVSEDVSRVDNVSRHPERARSLLRAYTRGLGAHLNRQTLRRDIEAYEDTSLSDDTVEAYLNALRRIFVIEEVATWNPNLRSKTAIRTSPTRYFSDPSIGAAALALSPDDLLNDLETMGLLFENLAVRDLRVYAEALGGCVYHYRDRNGLECDAIVRLPNGKYGLIEVKLSGAGIDDGAKSLNALENALAESTRQRLAFKMVLVGVFPQPFYRPGDNLHVVPIGTLGA
ncbi:MAG: DUF4143 domain-containing protein [Elusimicrobiales bacterium]|nr:DUF4143 domain-containing protein [Elusimicrobiales bacterium]